MTTTENPALKLALSTVANSSNNSSQANDDAPKPKLKWLNGDVMASNAKPPRYLIKGILNEDAHGIIYGASMTYKTFFALALAQSICTGRAFMGHAVKKTGKVLYICGEGENAMELRLKAQIIGNSQGFNNNFYFLTGSMRIDNDDDMNLLREAVHEIQPVFVMMDTFASLVSTTKESDNGDVGRVLRLVKETCRNGSTSSMIVHHCGKDESNGARGAYAFTGNTDFNFELNRENKAPVTTVTCHKQKEGAEFAPFSMMAEVVNLGIFDDDMDEATSLVLRQSDYVPAKDKKSLKPEHQKILAKLVDVIESDGVTPPKSVIDLFTDSKHNIPAKVTTISTWLDASLDAITVDSNSTEDKVILKAKTEKFRRMRTKIEELGRIGVHGDYIWIACAAKHLQPA